MNINKPAKYLLTGIIALLAIITLYYGINYWLIIGQNQQIEDIINKKPDTSGITIYKNKFGQSWQLPTLGKIAMKIGGKISSGPEFVRTEINPLKVSVGQKQTMTVEINSSKEIKKVIAEITTDHKTIKVELKQSNVREITYEDMNNQPFAIKDDGELVLKSDNKSNSRLFAELTNALFNKAKAANTMRYTYTGDWVAHDTGEITYTTKFIAYDQDNKSNNVVMAWSDPCSLPVSNQVEWARGAVSGSGLGFFTSKNSVDDTFTFQSQGGGINNGANCSDANLIGIENVDLIIGRNFTLTLSKDLLIFNPGHKITMDTNSIISLPDSNNTDSVGQITKGYLWVYDADGDGYFRSDVFDPNNIGTGPNGYHAMTVGNSAPEVRSASGNTSLLNKWLSFIKKASADTTCAGVAQPKWVSQKTIDQNHNFLAATSPKIDCDDTEPSANPGQTAFCANPLTSGGFDRNCNGVSEKEYNNKAFLSGNCSSCKHQGNDICEINKNINSSCSNNDGWSTNQVPDCGTASDYTTHSFPQVVCSEIPMTGNPNNCENQSLILANTESKTQACR